MRTVAWLGLLLLPAALPRAVAAEPAATPAPPPAICAATGDVTAVEEVLQCPASDTRRFVERSERRTHGWHQVTDAGDAPFSADEATQMDQLLAAGLARVCAGDTSADVRYQSLHTKELGYALDTCRGQRFLVVIRGKTRLALPGSPLVSELATVEWIVHLHDFGRRAVWPPP